MLKLTPEGERVAQSVAKGRRVLIRPRQTRQKSIFIACAFGRPDVDALCEQHLTPICSKLGYVPRRVDMSEPSETLTQAILDGILDAACMIADLTYARPSVYFEVGFAHGLGIPLLLTSRNDHLNNPNDAERVHFDLQQFKISFWSKERRGFKWPKGMSPDERLPQIVPKREAA